jgi:hypothetical protein
MRFLSRLALFGLVLCLGGLVLAAAVRADQQPQPPAPAGWGTIKGQIVFAGDKIPEPQKIDPDQDANHCLEKGPLFTEKWVVNPKNKGVRWAFVWLVTDPNPKNKEAPKMPIHPDLAQPKDKEVVMDQPCCKFEPHCLGIREGQTLVVKNSAPVSHNSKYDGPGDNPSGNPIIPAGKQVELTGFKASWSPMPISCGTHRWMGAWVRIFDHPYFAVTDADGNFEIKDAPAGNFWLVVWHEEGGWRDQKTVKINDKDVRQIGMPVTIKANAVADLGQLGIKPQ